MLFDRKCMEWWTIRWDNGSTVCRFGQHIKQFSKARSIFKIWSTNWYSTSACWKRFWMGCDAWRVDFLHFRCTTGLNFGFIFFSFQFKILSMYNKFFKYNCYFTQLVAGFKEIGQQVPGHPIWKISSPHNYWRLLL